MKERNKKLKTHLFLCLIIFISGCQQKNKEPKNLSEYRAWFLNEENGFVKKRCVNELCINIQYKPKELMAINEIKMLTQLNQHMVDSIVTTYRGSEYFMMEFSQKNSESADPLRIQGGSLEKYSKLTEDLAFQINEQLRVIKNNKDTLFASISHLEQAYELSGVKKIIIAFPGQFMEDDEILFIYDDQIFEMGRLKYKFEIKNKKIPTIPLKQTNEVN